MRLRSTIYVSFLTFSNNRSLHPQRKVQAKREKELA